VITAVVLASFILDNAQAVAAECERARLARECSAHPMSPACSAKVDASTLPTPSRAWAESWANESLASPLMSNPRDEAIHGLVYAWGESRYQDAPARGDHGKAACSLGVHAVYTPYTLEELEREPLKCIRAARAAMKWSFGVDVEHPMAAYCGCTVRSDCDVAERRRAVLKILVAKLPPIKETTT
jgi:hypothetical protein